MKKRFVTFCLKLVSFFMRDTLYYAILRKLKKKGIGERYDIRPLVNSHFRFKKLIKEKEQDEKSEKAQISPFSAAWNDVLYMFGTMQKNKHIIYDKNQFTPEWLADHKKPFIVILTYTGAEYFYSLRNMRRIFYTALTSAIIAAVSATVAIITLLDKSNVENRLNAIENRLNTIPHQQPQLPIKPNHPDSNPTNHKKNSKSG